MTIDQAIMIINAMKHWSVQCVNAKGSRKGYTCTLWNDGRRVTGQSGRSPLAAIQKAIAKLQQTTKGGTTIRIHGATP